MAVETVSLKTKLKQAKKWEPDILMRPWKNKKEDKKIKTEQLPLVYAPKNV